MITKSADRVTLSSGEVMTLGEAFDRGLVRPETTIGYGRNSTVSLHYIARDTVSRSFWEISQKFFESRGGVADPKHIKAHLDSRAFRF